MGVGVYESNFDGKGMTFLVSGPLLTQEDYAAYKTEAGAEAVDFGTWSQDQLDIWIQEFEAVLQKAATDAGLNLASRERNRFNRVDFDREIGSLAKGETIELGWRSWEHDFVVAVGPTGHAETLMNSDDDYVREETGVTAETLKNAHQAQVDAFLELLRIRLAEDGMECRFRTSGYTTSPYPKADKPDERDAELLKQIVERETWFAGLPESAPAPTV